MNLRDVFFQKKDGFLAQCWNNHTSKSPFVGKAIVYHHVTNDDLKEKPSCVCSIDVFKQTLETLEKEGYTFVSLNKMMEIIDSREAGKYIVITFDDVPSDVYENAYPILRKKQIPFALFVSNKYIGQDGFLSEEQIVELSNDPLCTIGAHTMTHPVLRNVTNSWEELHDSKTSLERLINKNVDFLAYPYGRHSSVSYKVRKQAKRAGFKSAFSTISAVINSKSAKSRFFLPRVVIN